MFFKNILFLSATVFLLSSNQNLYAHSGGTDSYGCHTNHSTGAYHCHNRKSYRSSDSSQARVPANLSSTDKIKISKKIDTKSLNKITKTVAQK